MDCCSAERARVDLQRQNKSQQQHQQQLQPLEQAAQGLALHSAAPALPTPPGPVVSPPNLNAAAKQFWSITLLHCPCGSPSWLQDDFLFTVEGTGVLPPDEIALPCAPS